MVLNHVCGAQEGGVTELAYLGAVLTHAVKADCALECTLSCRTRRSRHQRSLATLLSPWSGSGDHDLRLARQPLFATELFSGPKESRQGWGLQGLTQQRFRTSKDAACNIWGPCGVGNLTRVGHMHLKCCIVSCIIKRLFLFVFGSHPVELMTYCWLCAQGLILVGE